MQRPRPPLLAASIAGLALLAVGLAALVALRLGNAPAATAGASPFSAGSTQPSGAGPTGSARIDAAVCPLAQQPGPDDTVPRGEGDLTDVADLGNGRWRLCLTAPDTIVVEGSAWCTWSDDRSTVREITGLPVDAGGAGKADGGVNLRTGQAYLGLTSFRGDILSFAASGEGLIMDPDEGGGAGATAFRATAQLDPEHPPVVTPADRVGTMRWSCGKPPGPRPGRSTGRVDLRLDEPAAGRWQVAAACSWENTATGPRLQRLETDPAAIVRDGRKLAIDVEPDVLRPDGAEVSLWVDDGTHGDFYSEADPLAIRQAVDGSSGLIRIRHLRIDPSAEVRIMADVTDVSGVVTWACPPPTVAGPNAREPAPGEVSETHPGTATIALDPAVSGPIRGAITCTVDRSNPPTVQVTGIEGALVAAGGRLIVRADLGTALVAVVGPDGQPAGEYVGPVTSESDDASLPSLRTVADPVAFEPTDPRYVPIGGPSAPRQLRLQIDYACDMESASP